MARPNLPRTVGSEANLAERLKHERELRGWSPAELARQLTNAGCSISTSAIYKIEDTEKPRRITVDELVAASAVFGISTSDLLVPVELVRQERARAIVRELEDAERDMAGAVTRYLNAYTDLADIAASQDTDLFEFTMNLSGHRADATAGGDAENILEAYGSNGEPLGVNTTRLREAMSNLFAAMIQVAVDASEAKQKGAENGQH